jgi:hypothetical protein
VQHQLAGLVPQAGFTHAAAGQLQQPRPGTGAALLGRRLQVVAHRRIGSRPPQALAAVLDRLAHQRADLFGRAARPRGAADQQRLLDFVVGRPQEDHQHQEQQGGHQQRQAHSQRMPARKYWQLDEPRR